MIYLDNYTLIKLKRLDKSKLLDTSKLDWFLDAFKYSSSVFYVRVVVFYSRAEDVIQTVLPHKNV